jgi:hypothetical protein
MATQKEMRTMREQMVEVLSGVGFAGYTFEGVVRDGVLLRHEENETYVVLKPIVKKEEFDAEDALEEYAEKVAKAAEREKEKAEKAAKREAKEKEEAE